MRIGRLLVVLGIVLSLLSFGCGGDGTGSEQDTITLTVSGPSGTVTTTYVEGTYDTEGQPDPDMFSHLSANNDTYIQLSSGAWHEAGSSSLWIGTYGSEERQYSTGPAPSVEGFIDYTFSDTQYHHYTSRYSTERGTITLSSIGAVGEKISGTFDVPVASPTNTSETLRLTGSFSVTRER